MTYEDYCPNCKTVSKMDRTEGATVGLRCQNCGKNWAAPMLDEAQEHDPGYGG